MLRTLIRGSASFPSVVAEGQRDRTRLYTGHTFILGRVHSRSKNILQLAHLCAQERLRVPKYHKTAHNFKFKELKKKAE